MSKQYEQHGHRRNGTATRVYRIWKGMLSRCYTPCDNSYRNYGRRGIKVCQRWRESFKDFLLDMGEPPTAKHTIERRDSNKHYTPQNCCWATQKEQCNNKRNNHMVTFAGTTKSLTMWAEMTGIRQPTLRDRLRRGWSIEKTLMTPTRSKNGQNNLVRFRVRVFFDYCN